MSHASLDMQLLTYYGAQKTANMHYMHAVADPENSKGRGRSGKGGTPQKAKKFMYLGYQILSFTNIL
jgi:hypothetical protein